MNSPLLDMRTKIGQEHKVLCIIKFSPDNIVAYWVLDYPSNLAAATQRLIDKGKIKSIGGDWPYTKWEIVEEK